MQKNELFISETKKYVNQLSSLRINAPIIDAYPMQTLKRLERTGKKIRFNNFGLTELKCRTIYDHIFSLAEDASVLSNLSPKRINEKKVALYIAYHDVCESVIGDIPSFSEKFNTNDYSAVISHTDKIKRETIADDYLSLFADDEQKKCFARLKHMRNNSVDSKFFVLLDAIDPIIAVWKYIYRYRNASIDKQRFFIAMNDFFINPDLTAYLADEKYNFIRPVLSVLCDGEKAEEFWENGDFGSFCDDAELSAALNLLIIESSLFYDDKGERL